MSKLLSVLLLAVSVKTEDENSPCYKLSKKIKKINASTIVDLDSKKKRIR